MRPAIYMTADLMGLAGFRDRRAFRAWLDRATAMGFPKPLPGRGRARWSAVQVDAWFACGGRPAAAKTTTGQDGRISDLDAARARLAVTARIA